MKFTLAAIAASVASVQAFSGATVQRRGTCTFWQTECDDGSCVSPGLPCTPSYGGGSSGGTGCSIGQVQCDNGSCAYSTQSCSYTSSGNWNDAASAYYKAKDYSGYVSGCNGNDVSWTECVNNAKAVGWTEYSKYMGQYGSYSQYANTPYYTAAEYYDADKTYRDYIQWCGESGSDWSVCTNAAGVPDYSQWTNYNGYAKKYASWEQYKDSEYWKGAAWNGDYAQYIKNQWTSYGADDSWANWAAYAAAYVPGDMDWVSYAKAADNKNYGEWRTWSKIADNYGSYADYRNSDEYWVNEWTPKGCAALVNAARGPNWKNYMSVATKVCPDGSAPSKYNSYEAYKASKYCEQASSYVERKGYCNF